MAAMIFERLTTEQASQYLADYCDRANAYAWPLYDEDPHPGVLDGADLCAPALLSYPMRGTYLNWMGQSVSEGESVPYRELFLALEGFVGSPDTGLPFEQIDRSLVEDLARRENGAPVEGPDEWQRLVRCLDAAAGCQGLTSVAVTKILHRKRPTLVPINDSRVRDFFGVRGGYPGLFAAIHAELNDRSTIAALRDLAGPYRTPGGRPMTELRALDIIVWMHEGSS